MTNARAFSLLALLALFSSAPLVSGCNTDDGGDPNDVRADGADDDGGDEEVGTSTDALSGTINDPAWCAQKGGFWNPSFRVCYTCGYDASCSGSA